ncbi:MAG TPA: sigma-70 family RNA polymerase sigma factor [Crocinitomicaceae bacterium]|nr:sigma-70 family RNA polymerase sigma factor [Crocinitomicaceae bacterium]
MRVSGIYHQTDIQQLNELEVVQQAKNDPTKFEPLYRKYHNQIYRYVYHRIDDECLAADITSQVFLKALNNLHRYEYRGVPFASWLYRIAKSEVYQSYRNDKSNKVVNIDLANISSLMDEMEDETFKDEKIAHIIKQLKTLKEHELAMIEMRFFEKRSFKEIGEILFITENNAKVKCFRIIEKLKKAV